MVKRSPIERHRFSRWWQKVSRPTGVVSFAARVNKSRACNGPCDDDEKGCLRKGVQRGIVNLYTHRCLLHTSASTWWSGCRLDGAANHGELLDKRTRHCAVTNPGAADNSIPMCANLLGLALIGLGHPGFAIFWSKAGYTFLTCLRVPRRLGLAPQPARLWTRSHRFLRCRASLPSDCHPLP